MKPDEGNVDDGDNLKTTKVHGFVLRRRHRRKGKSSATEDGDDDYGRYEVEPGENWLRFLQKERHSLLDETQDSGMASPSSDEDNATSSSTLLYPSILSVASVGVVPTAPSPDCYICLDLDDSTNTLTVKDMRVTSESEEAYELAATNNVSTAADLGLLRKDSSTWELLPKRQLRVLRPGDRICTSLSGNGTVAGDALVLQYAWTVKNNPSSMSTGVAHESQLSTQSRQGGVGPLLTQSPRDSHGGMEEDSQVKTQSTSFHLEVMAENDEDDDSDKTVEMSQTQPPSFEPNELLLCTQPKPPDSSDDETDLGGEEDAVPENSSKEEKKSDDKLQKYTKEVDSATNIANRTHTPKEVMASVTANLDELPQSGVTLSQALCGETQDSSFENSDDQGSTSNKSVSACLLGETGPEDVAEATSRDVSSLDHITFSQQQTGQPEDEQDLGPFEEALKGAEIQNEVDPSKNAVTSEAVMDKIVIKTKDNDPDDAKDLADDASKQHHITFSQQQTGQPEDEQDLGPFKEALKGAEIQNEVDPSKNAVTSEAVMDKIVIKTKDNDPDDVKDLADDAPKQHHITFSQHQTGQLEDEQDLGPFEEALKGAEIQDEVDPSKNAVTAEAVTDKIVIKTKENDPDDAKDLADAPKQRPTPPPESRPEELGEGFGVKAASNLTELEALRGGHDGPENCAKQIDWRKRPMSEREDSGAQEETTTAISRTKRRRDDNEAITSPAPPTRPKRRAASPIQRIENASTQRTNRKGSQSRKRSKTGQRDETIRVMATGVEISSTEKKMIRQIGAVFLDKLSDAHAATHVISGSPLRRTPKLMIGFCRTGNIVSLDWLKESAKEQKSLPSRKFLLVHDAAAEKQYNFRMRDTLRRSAKMRSNGVSVFAGFSVYVCAGVAGNTAKGNRTPPMEEFKHILEAAGGAWIRTLPSANKKSAVFSPIILVVSKIQKEAKKQVAVKAVAAAVNKGATTKTTEEIFHAIMTQDFEL